MLSTILTLASEGEVSSSDLSRQTRDLTRDPTVTSLLKCVTLSFWEMETDQRHATVILEFDPQSIMRANFNKLAVSLGLTHTNRHMCTQISINQVRRETV